MEKKPNPLHLLIIIPPERLPAGAQVIDARHIDLDFEDEDFGDQEQLPPVRMRATPLRLPAGSRKRRPSR